MTRNFAPPLAASLWLISLPCFANVLPNGYEIIGNYAVAVDAEAIESQSYYSAGGDFSDLTFNESFGIKTYHVSGSVNDDIPLLEVVLQEGSVVGELSIVNVTFIDQDYDTALAAAYLETAGVALESYGAIMDETIEMGADGAISFAFIADFIRIDLDTDTPITGETGARVEVRFSGTFPANELSE